MTERICILGTGLIGASIGLALKASPEFRGTILGWDANPAELAAAQTLGAIDRALASRDQALSPALADIYILCTPVIPILDWLERLAPVLTAAQLVTDVGSTKLQLCELASTLYNGPGQPAFLPGHPMAGKESGGAAHAEATLFHGARWLFTPCTHAAESPLATAWRAAVATFGAHTQDLDAAQHDELCAWVSHLPQLLSTALAALLEDTFAATPEKLTAVQAIGGRALRETTRLGASPYSMWRDIALTNTGNVAATLHALEQRLAHLRENLRTPELRDEFKRANQFRSSKP